MECEAIEELYDLNNKEDEEEIKKIKIKKKKFAEKIEKKTSSCQSTPKKKTPQNQKNFSFFQY